MSRWVELALFLTILSVAIFLRLRSLENVPPGLSHDELTNSQMAEDVLQGARPIYFAGGYGHEPLYLYLMAATVRLFGNNAFGIRLPSVLCGLLGIGASYALARKLFGVKVALITAAGLAVSWWPVFYSRVGLRAIALPLFAAPSALFLWQGISRSSPATSRRDQAFAWAAFALAGFFLGFSLYTYTSSRLIPVVFALFAGYLALFRRSLFKHTWTGFALCLILAGLIFLPLGYYLYTHPGVEARIDQLGEPLRDLARGNLRPALEFALATLKIFGLRGEYNPRYNLPFRPVFDPVSALLFWGGIALCLARWRQAEYAFLLIWFPITLIPSMVTLRSPSTIRAIGCLPVLYIFPALSAVALSNWLRHRVRERWGWPAVGCGLAILFAANFLWLYRDYFLLWPQHPKTREIYQSTLTEICHYLDQSPDSDPVWISESFDDHRHLLLPSRTLHRQDLRIEWFDARNCLIFPRNEQTIRYILPEFAPLDPTLEDLLQEAQLLAQSERKTADGRPIFTIYRLQPRQMLTARIEALSLTSPAAWSQDGELETAQTNPLSMPVDFNHQLDFLGYELLNREVRPGGEILLLTYWRPRQVILDPLRIFVHVLNSHSVLVSGQDVLDMLPWDWQVGDIYVQLHRLPIAAETAAGKYWLELGLYRTNDLQRWLIYDGEDAVADRLLLQTVEVDNLAQ
ncbi:MAG: glycosyltransferase family 39 protein [Anaerolineae bacterium]|nr:glycosyltransferase family 39 protein [Anaerolineae bacterium]